MINVKCIASSSSGNCYLIDDGKTSLLLDAGVKLTEIQKACGFNLSGISGSLITHDHKDHSYSVDNLIRRGVPVYGNLNTAIKHNGMKSISEGKRLSIGTFDIIAKRVEHDADCFCYYLYSLTTEDVMLYITDASSIAYKFFGVTQMLIEANYSSELLKASDKPEPLKRRIQGSHLSIEQTRDYIAENSKYLEHVYLCHLSDDDSDAEMFASEIIAVTNAKVYVCEKNGGVSCKI